jgi:hypothetical protein
VTEPALVDFRGREVVAALLSSAVVLVGAALALQVASLDRPAAVPEIDPGTALPVKIVPVLDLDSPLLKLGGKPDHARLPDRWVRRRPVPRVAQKAFVSTKAGKTEHDLPPPDVPIADAGAKVSPPEAEVTKQVDTPFSSVVDAGAPANVDQVGHADGVTEGTETDPLKARAVDVYRAKIAAWFSSRFGVHGSGLDRAELQRIRVHAVVQIGAGHLVAGYTLSPSGNAAFNEAARAALEGAKGQAIPPPPENYPDVEQSQIHITFVCRANRCD